mgnify:CR=1 FL=1
MPAAKTPPARPQATVMLSRVAHSLYWMSRYIERAENVARFIDVNQAISLGGRIGTSDQWAPLIFASGLCNACFTELMGAHGILRA